jgi:hypothetical protein
MWYRRVQSLLRALKRAEMEVLEVTDLDECVDAEITLAGDLSLQVTTLGEVGINRYEREDGEITSVIMLDYYGNQVPSREIVAHAKDALLTC